MRFVSGVERDVPEGLDPTRVVGLDYEGRWVVDDFGGFAPEVGSFGTPFLFGLTLCCTASDKGTEHGNVCRACYGASDDPDEGLYLFRWPGGYGAELNPRVDLLDVRPEAREHLAPGLLEVLTKASA